MKRERTASHGLGFYIRHYFVAALNLVAFVERAVTVAAAHMVDAYPLLEQFFERYLGQIVVFSWCSLIYIISPYYKPYEPFFKNEIDPGKTEDHPKHWPHLQKILGDLDPDIDTWMGMRALFFKKMFEQNSAFLEWCWDSYLVIQCIEWSPMLSALCAENIVPAAMTFAFLFSYLRFGLLQEERRSLVTEIKRVFHNLQGGYSFYQIGRNYVVFFSCLICSYSSLLIVLNLSDILNYALAVVHCLSAWSLPLDVGLLIASALMIVSATPYPIDSIKILGSLFWNNYRYITLVQYARLLELVMPGAQLAAYPIATAPIILFSAQYAYEQWCSSEHRYYFNSINEDPSTNCSPTHAP